MAVGISHSVLNDFNLDDIDPMICTEPDNDKPWRWWRYLPNTDADVMIISSYGAVYPQQVKIAEKVVSVDNTGTDRLALAREEMDWLMDLIKQDKKRHIVYSYSECGAGLQMSRDYYINRMRKLFRETNKEWVFLFYTGNSEEGSGNWCFKDGVISFQNIYDLYYVECFKGKRLGIISDCSYSGRWVKDCVKIYDDQGIPSCGHHSREKGMLINVWTSCKSYQQATIMAFIKEAMIVVDEVIFFGHKQLSSGQTKKGGDFSMIRCDNKPDECCQFTASDPQYTWENMILRLGERVYTVRGKDRGKPVWHYVLVDEEKVEALKEQIKTGQVCCADYGEVLYSGWGENPPQEINDTINKHFNLNTTK